jgi:hypothetical protein
VALLLMPVAVFVMSAFVSDTPIVVLMIPMHDGITLRVLRAVSANLMMSQLVHAPARAEVSATQGR